jgi:hypothetical protein
VPVPRLEIIDAADAVSSAHRELVAAAAALSARVVEAPDTPFAVRKEAERVAMVVDFEATRLAEVIPTLRAISTVHEREQRELEPA